MSDEEAAHQIVHTTTLDLDRARMLVQLARDLEQTPESLVHEAGAVNADPVRWAQWKRAVSLQLQPPKASQRPTPNASKRR